MKLWFNLNSQLAIVCSLCLSGCGTNTDVGTVKGQVTLNGHPAQIENLWITFLSADGQLSASPVDDQGLFESPEIPVGETRVGFNIAGLAAAPDENAMPFSPSNVPTGQQTINPQELEKQMKAQQQKQSSPYDQKNLPFRKKYLDPLTSGLTISIQAGQELEFNPEILAP